MNYRILKVVYSYEVQRYGMVMLDGCPDYTWKTLARFQDEDEARKYLESMTST